MSTRTPATIEEEPLPSLDKSSGMITFTNAEGHLCCLGYLLVNKGEGVFDATYGRVDVTPEEAKKHNELLDVAHVKGLTESCRIGQGGLFYIKQQDQQLVVTTWLGTVVGNCRRVPERTSTYEFKRDGRTFRGYIRRRKQGESVFFRRVS